MNEACASCGAALAADALACPSCRRLVHADRLASLSAEAEAATAAGELERAREAWRAVLELLPREAGQYAAVESKLASLDVAPEPEQERPAWTKRAGALGAAALLVWKVKPILAFVITKGKFLLLGLTKAKTFFSMFLALGVYWTAWGWQFALGLVLSIYIHEIGHVAALSQLGIPARAPLFIPGFGAIVRMEAYPKTPHDDALVGLAGPIWGLAAAIASWAIGAAFDAPFFIALARVGALINLFNLVPVWQLDGSRGFRALSRRYRWYVVGAIALAWVFVEDGMLLLVLVVAAARTAFTEATVEEPDGPILLRFLVLIAALAALMALDPGLPVP